LGKIFEIDVENPLHRKKIFEIDQADRIFEKTSPFQNPGNTHGIGHL
jgi:hypothetical protein